MEYQGRLGRKNTTTSYQQCMFKFKKHAKDPSYLILLKKRNSNFKLLVTLPNNAKASKRVSVTVSSHQIRLERKERATKSLLQEKKRNISQPSEDIFEILHHLNAYWKTVYILHARRIRYAIGFSNSGLKKRHRKFRRTIQFFQAAVLQPTVICLIKRAADKLTDQFSSRCREKGLVSTNYSSGAEFPTAIADRLREQQGATQIPESSRATYGYRANNGTVIQY